MVVDSSACNLFSLQSSAGLNRQPQSIEPCSHTVSGAAGRNLVNPTAAKIKAMPDAIATLFFEHHRILGICCQTKTQAC
jgi:hypothetical protein